ncbi:MAG: hypothetical protein O3B81_04105 [Actinomycetota bacterium]|nr:hypothetical protein [Actinomycetota bacterium]
MTKALVALIFFATQAIVVAPSNALPTLHKKQTSNVKALFAAFATSNPDKIAAASVKYTKAGSAARNFAEMVKNNHATIRYYKAINVFGMPSGLTVTPEAKGKSTLKGKTVTLNSVNDAFDGKYTAFTFDSKGKISNFKVATNAGKSSRKVSDRIFAIKQSVTSGAMFVTGGYVYKQPDAKLFVQMQVKNNSASLKSWSYANGRFASAENKYYASSISPVGCLYPGQTAFMQATVSDTPVVVAGTGAAYEAPTFEGCGNGSSNASSVFRFITG